MTITEAAELEALRKIGRITANALQLMGRSLEPGMTTAELDAIGRAYLEQEGAESAPESCYNFPGATCISVNEEAAHGIPGDRVLRLGDLVNIDVSASKDGFFGDTGASFALGAVDPRLTKLCRDGRKAMRIGIDQVGAGKPMAGVGKAIGQFADKNGYTLIRNLCSHGIGRSLHEFPEELATWPNRRERRVIERGLVLTIEPFLSLGADWADTGDDGWTLYASPSAPVVQYEHTVVATTGAPIILTLPG